MCLGGLLTFLRSNFRFGRRERGRRWEWEIRIRIGCCEVGGFIGGCCEGGGESIGLVVLAVGRKRQGNYAER
jgi:hypothetical protein